MRKLMFGMSWRMAVGGVLVGLVGLSVAYGERAKLWMVWDATRADTGRVSQPVDPMAYRSVERAVADRVALRTVPTPASVEAIPMPIEPGSRVTGIEIPPEDLTLVVPAK